MKKALNFGASLGMLGAVWAVDRLVAGQASMSVLYLIPIGYAAWYCGAPWGYVASVLSAAAWLQADIAVSRSSSHWLIPYWNAAVRLGFFAVVAVLSGAISRLRELVDRERAVSQLKSDMVSLVSHEFGSSLTVLRLSIDLLKDSEGDQAAPRATFYATIDRVYTHLLSSVTTFLNLNRIESGHFTPVVRRTELRTLVHGLVAQLGPLIESKAVKLRLELPDFPVPVLADPDALSVVLNNLLGNAFKYTSDGGSVTLRVTPWPESGVCEVGVEDTGIGIQKEELAHVTAGYYRGPSGRRMARGFGVGLKVVRDLLDSLGSRLVIDSEPGRGSRFYFVLPLWVRDLSQRQLHKR